ncbi:MAG: alpha/beta fold hydrolase [Vicinamibacterales bacterium]
MYLIVGAVVALLVGAGAVYQLIGSRRSARRYAAPGVMIDVDGQQLHMVCAGSGQPPVLFESGIAASSLSWARVQREVGTFTRTCAYDRAGLGWSAPARGVRTVDRILGELRGVLTEALPAGSAVLVGHSFGAFLVCAYASRHPADVAGLVLLDPPSEWHEPTRQQARLLLGGIHLSRLGAVLARVGVVRASLAMLTGGAPGAARTFARLFGPTATRTLERLVGEARKLPPEVHPLVQAIWCEPKCFRAMANHLAALEKTASVVGRVTSLPDIPVVVISSGEQSVDVIERHRLLAHLSPSGRHVLAPGSGHWIPFDDPDLVIATIREIIDHLRRTRPVQGTPDESIARDERSNHSPSQRRQTGCVS